MPQKEGPIKAFLSYVSRDRAWAKRLAAKLDDAGVSVWDAEKEVLPGENLGLALGRALENSDVFVVLISPASSKSRWMEQEVQYAIANPRFEDRIFPVLLKPTADYPWFLRRLEPLKGSPEDVARNIAASVHSAA